MIVKNYLPIVNKQRMLFGMEQDDRLINHLSLMDVNEHFVLKKLFGTIVT